MSPSTRGTHQSKCTALLCVLRSGKLIFDEHIFLKLVSLLDVHALQRKTLNGTAKPMLKVTSALPLVPVVHAAALTHGIIAATIF